MPQQASPLPTQKFLTTPLSQKKTHLKSPTENLLRDPVELSLIRETRTPQVLQSHLPLQQWFSLVAEYTFVVKATVNNDFID